MIDASASRVSRLGVTPGASFGPVARDILEDHHDALPDLSGVVVVLPNLHCASELARALTGRAGRILLLPRMVTLAGWCAARPAPAESISTTAREAALFDALRSRNWFESSDLWTLIAELAQLLDDLTRHGVRLPESEEEFVHQLETAYRAKAGEPMQFEARLVHELWRASSRPEGGAVDAVALYHMQLARLAKEAVAPLYAIGLAALTPAEEEFFEMYAERAPVRIYRIEPDSGASESDAAALLASAWPEASRDADDLRARASAFAERSERSPIAGKLALFAASSLEQEARAVETQIRSWLVEGTKSVAVVALDRVVARRIRALLERAKVMVADETGWIFSTTSAATVIMRWLDVLSGGFYHQDVIDLLKSPFIFYGWGERREAAFRLERIIRSQSIVDRLDNYFTAARTVHDDVLVLEVLQRLQHAARLFARDRRRALHEWLTMLHASLEALGVDRGLRSDPAGFQLLDLLELRLRETLNTRALFSFAEWRQWLNRQLESAEFRDTGIASPVIFTHLAATRLRHFEAVAIVGCDAAHLPGNLAEDIFFNQSVRRQLGLPAIEHRLAQIRDDLIGLLSRSGSVLASWQKLKSGEKNLVSPLFERLQVFHQLAWKTGLEDHALVSLIGNAELSPPLASPLPAVSRRPIPAVRSDLIPQRISASGYNSLLACPYQFYARYALGLREPEEVREAMEKRDYGEHVHRILRRFHSQFPVAGEAHSEELIRSLEEISAQVFSEATEANYLSHAWALRWQALIPLYIDWHLAREREGWRFHAAEVEREIEIELPDGHKLALEGRIDRVDRRAPGGSLSYAVLDYKTRNAKLLREGLREPGEDVQLPVYVALLGEPISEAFYLSLERREFDDVPLEADVLADTHRAVDRLREIFAQLYRGAPVPAQGIDSVCQYCEMQGLCRKQHWA